MTFITRRLTKLIVLLQLLTGSLTAMASSPLDESLLGKYGPDRDAFLKLCAPLVSNKSAVGPRQLIESNRKCGSIGSQFGLRGSILGIKKYFKDQVRKSPRA